MSKLNLTALLLGAALFTGLGAVSLSASDSKCGAGKCGDAKMEKPTSNCKCSEKEVAQKCKCDAPKKPDMKCGAGKCGSN